MAFPVVDQTAVFFVRVVSVCFQSIFLLSFFVSKRAQPFPICDDFVVVCTGTAKISNSNEWFVLAVDSCVWLYININGQCHAEMVEM